MAGFLLLVQLLAGAALAPLGSPDWSVRHAAQKRFDRLPTWYVGLVLGAGGPHPDPEVRLRCAEAYRRRFRSYADILCDPAVAVVYGPGRVVESVPDLTTLPLSVSDRVNTLALEVFGPDYWTPAAGRWWADCSDRDYALQTARLAVQLRGYLRGVEYGYVNVPDRGRLRPYNPWVD